MDSASPRRRGTTAVAIAGVSVLGAVVAIGAVLPPWPLLSRAYFGQSSPIENFVQVVFDYPVSSAFLYARDVPAGVRAAAMAPVVLQALIVLVMTFATARLLAGIAGGSAFATPVRRALTLLSATALIGGLLQFGIGLLAWHVGTDELNPIGASPYTEAILSRPPFPSWPVTLLILGIVTAALRVAFRDGARLEEAAEGVV